MLHQYKLHDHVPYESLVLYNLDVFRQVIQFAKEVNKVDGLNVYKQGFHILQPYLIQDLQFHYPHNRHGVMVVV